MQIPLPENLEKYAPALAVMVAKTSWLPHPETVKAIGQAVFPTVRGERMQPFVKDDEIIGMYDDNATPEWALFWSHGLKNKREKGWTLGHVWAESKDIGAFTHPANLILVHEPFAGLTDKNGPLTAFLKYHAWKVYGWKPEIAEEPDKPKGYDKIQWRYLSKIENPLDSIKHEFLRRNNKRTIILRPIMKKMGML